MNATMSDALLSSTVKVLVEKAIFLASQQIGLFRDFKKDLEKLKKSFTMIQAVLTDAEKKQVTQESVKLWLMELERLAFDAHNLLDDFNYEIIRRKVEIQNQMKRKVRFFFSRSNLIAFRVKMTNKIQKINMDLKRINEEAKNFGLQSGTGARDAPVLPSSQGLIKLRETVSIALDSSFVGRDDDISAIIKKLTTPSNNENISVLPIVGMGGIGKTTLARKVFNDPKIEKHFNDRIWVCVSDDFDENRLFGLILEQLQGKRPETESKEARVSQLKELLKGKKYLLVLDDVWNDKFELWDGFLRSFKGISSSNGNCILLTTREKKVAAITRISFPPCSLEKLSDDECWLIFKENAFVAGEMPDDELQEIGSKIAQKCNGLPLAASVLGGMLRYKGRDEWLSTLEIGLQNSGVEENIVTKILKLSFDHLPSLSLKKCFAYCSTFPKDFKIERNQLIQLWAAEGFLHSNPRNTLDMEKEGEKFFTILLDGNLFQEAVKDEYGNVLNCKMHDLVHDLVLSISESKTLRLNESRRVDDQDHETFPVRFLVMERSGEEEIPPSPLKESFRYITTLEYLKGKLNDNLISSFTCLRVLNFASSNVHELPKSIGKLSHLRCLDSSNTSITLLPDSICKLYHLQTLRVKNCRSLTSFPNKFKNLLSLRHFDFFTEDRSSSLMPLEIGQLKCLQTLPFFNIGVENGRLLGELRNLENLSGCLEIRNFELVKNKDEAESANLVRKSNICELRLLWNESDNRRGNESKENQVLEGLEPHANLKGLVIRNFLGDQLSPWFEKLENLVRLELVNCIYCREIPALGHIRSLKFLKLEGLDGVTIIRPSFYGGGMSRQSSRSSSNQEPVKLFPALEHFILDSLPNLTEWTEVAFHDGMMVVFPVLEKIEISDCPQLATLPSHFPRLHTLNISCINHAAITRICNDVRTLRDLWISRVSQVTELPLGLFQNNPNLATLELTFCDDLTHISDVGSGVQTLEAQNCQIISELNQSRANNTTQHLGALGSLQQLEIYSCDQLKSISIHGGHLRYLRIGNCDALTNLSIPEIVGRASESESSSSSTSNTCPFLETLYVYECPNLISFPVDLNRTPSLSVLGLDKCKKLRDLPKGKLCSLTSLRELWIGPFSNTTDLHSFLHLFNGLHHLPLLSELGLHGWPHWECLPHQLQHLSALQFLRLDGFGVKSLPDWFGKLSSLQILRLSHCENLENLPSHQSMRSLTKLRELEIVDCPLLKERCNPQSSSSPNSEWSKISHIPNIYIDGLPIRR